MDRNSGTVIIPAMGRSQRFKDHGFMTHKALLKVDGVPLIKRIVDTIPAEWDIRLIIPDELSQDFRAALGDRATYITLAGPTEGQSQTILRGLLGINAAKMVAITNCDVLFDPAVVQEVLETEGAQIVCHTDFSDDAPFSYVRLNANNTVAEVKEKIRISRFAQTGFWKFRAGRLHIAIARQINSDLRHTNGEFYLSDAINLYTQSIGVKLILDDMWQDFGTPQAILARGHELV